MLKVVNTATNYSCFGRTILVFGFHITGLFPELFLKGNYNENGVFDNLITIGITF